MDHGFGIAFPISFTEQEAEDTPQSLETVLTGLELPMDMLVMAYILSLRLRDEIDGKNLKFVFLILILIINKIFNFNLINLNEEITGILSINSIIRDEIEAFILIECLDFNVSITQEEFNSTKEFLT